jgi:hypothetical protein
MIDAGGESKDEHLQDLIVILIVRSLSCEIRLEHSAELETLGEEALRCSRLGSPFPAKQNSFSTPTSASSV